MYDKNLILQNFTLIFYIKPKLSQKRALPQCLLRKAGSFCFLSFVFKLVSSICFLISLFILYIIYIIIYIIYKAHNDHFFKGLKTKNKKQKNKTSALKNCTGNEGVRCKKSQLHVSHNTQP